MAQEQENIKKMSGIGVVAAFGLLTMTSTVANYSLTASNTINKNYYEAKNYIYENTTLCNSSTLYKNAIGDIISDVKKNDFLQQHEKKEVTLQITKITKHISNFDFEEEYEEI